MTSPEWRKELENLALHHDTQALHFEPFGACNVLTVFHRAAAETCRAALLAHLDAPIEPADTFWLIERGPNQGDIHHWWFSLDLKCASRGAPYGDWTQNVHEATRFATQNEAWRMAHDCYATNYAITSHSFVNAAPQPAPIEPAEPVAWIPVSEGLPEMSEARPANQTKPPPHRIGVIVATDKGRVFETIYSGLGWANLGRDEHVTDWMPKPVHPSLAAPQAAGPVASDGVWEALQRLIENAAMLGPSSQDDALVVAKWRGRFIAAREQAAQAAQPPAPITAPAERPLTETELDDFAEEQDAQPLSMSMFISADDLITPQELQVRAIARTRLAEAHQPDTPVHAAPGAFEEWKERYALVNEPNYSLHTEADCLAAYQAGRASLMQAAGMALEALEHIANYEDVRKYVGSVIHDEALAAISALSAAGAAPKQEP